MYTQEEVYYRRGYPLRQCSVCAMYRKDNDSGYGSCTDVRGSITPYGVCDEFARLDNPYGNRLDRQAEAAIGQIYDGAHGYGTDVAYNKPYYRRGAGG